MAGNFSEIRNPGFVARLILFIPITSSSYKGVTNPPTTANTRTVLNIPLFSTSKDYFLPPPATMASTTAQRRLFQEYKALSNNPPEGITAGPVSEDDLLYWEALIQGPEGTPFEGGVFPAELKFPKDYPLAPPSMRFLGEVWHPNGKSFPLRHEYWGWFGWD